MMFIVMLIAIGMTVEGKRVSNLEEQQPVYLYGGSDCDSSTLQQRFSVWQCQPWFSFVGPTHNKSASYRVRPADSPVVSVYVCVCMCARLFGGRIR